MAATLRGIIGGQPVTIKHRSLSIEKAINQQSTMSALVVVKTGTPPSARQKIGVVKDEAPGARVFNGTTSVLSRAFSSGVVNNFTLVAWLYPDSTADLSVPLYIGRDANGYGIRVNGGNWTGYYSGALNLTGSAVVNQAWQHVALRRASGTTRLFVQGQPVGSTSATAPAAAPDGHLSVGARRNAANNGFDSYFAGRIAHVAVVHAALTDAQILALAAGGPGGMGMAVDHLASGTYWSYPIHGTASPEPDTAASTSLSVTSAVATTDGPEVFSAGGMSLFAGSIDQAPVSGLGGHGVAATEVRVAAIGYENIMARKVLNLSRPSESLTARLTAIITASLAADGVTLGSSQDTGPTLAARDYVYVPLPQAFDELTTETGGRVAVLGDLLTLTMLAPSSLPSAFDIEDGDGHAIGDIVVEETVRGYANRLYGRLGDARVVEKTEGFTGDGSTSAWTLSYPVAGTRGYVTANGNFETLGVGAQWSINGSNQLVRRDGALTNGHVVSIVYDAQFPIVRMVEDAGEQALYGIWEAVSEYSDVFDIGTGEAMLDGELVARTTPQHTIRYRTLEDGLEIGALQGFDVASRFVGDAVVSGIVITDLGPTLLDYRVRAESGLIYRAWQQTFQSWGGGAGVSNIAVPSVAAPLSLGGANVVEFQSVPFNAGDFTAGGGTWTVQSSDMSYYRFKLAGKTIVIQLNIGASSVSGGPVELRAKLPINTSVTNTSGICLVGHNGTYGLGMWTVDADQLAIRTVVGGFVWPNSTNQTDVVVDIEVPLAA